MRQFRLAAATLSLTAFVCSNVHAQEFSLDDLLSEIEAPSPTSPNGNGSGSSYDEATEAVDAGSFESFEDTASGMDDTFGAGVDAADEFTSQPLIEEEPASIGFDDSGFGEPAIEEQAPAAISDFQGFDEPISSPAPVAADAGFDTGFDAIDAAPIEEGVAEEPAPRVTEKPDDAAKASARLIAQQEEVRRQAKEVQANKSYREGMAAFNAGKYDQAVKLLEDANANLPPRPGNEVAIQQIKSALAESHLLLARERMETDINAARKSIDQALRIAPDNRKAQSLEKRITSREARVAAQVARPRSVIEQPKYSDKYTQIDALLREGRDLFDAREFNDSENAFERVLVLDEYNIEAMRFLRKIEDTRYDLRTREREATVSEMMAMVRDTWNPPIRTDAVAPIGSQPQTQIDALTSQQKLQNKMESIVIPSIEFRQANIADVVNFLVDASVAGDPDAIGVNIILKLTSGPEAAPAAPAAPSGGGFDDFSSFGSSFQEPAATTPGASSVPAITLNLRRINLLDAIKYITEVADLRYRLEDNVVVITPANVVSGRVITRMYPVQPSILDVIVERGEDEGSSRGQGDFIGMATQTTVKRTDVKDFFERAGVPFPVGTSITYNQGISQLIVANTVENLETFERILSRLNVIPNQVEIEARFVEVNQSNLEELGFQWFLTDNWEIAQKKGGAFPAATETIIMGADSRGLSKGNRFFSSDNTTLAVSPKSTVTQKPLLESPLGGIATFASVLTNPELQVIINALSQKGNADLLSAPRVTTRSGNAAQIQVVEEIIYPTEFESETITFEREAAGGGTIQERFVTVTPGSFTTREVGVILNVTPIVGADGYTIDLTLTPEVAELVDWIQYGSQVGDLNYNIPQPTFASRKVSTSIVVWDGQTVVMGGLIKEDLVKYDDKIPLLGDIPIIGRLFRSKGEYSQKKNLLIFVTARLVGPDGRPIQRGDSIVPGAGEAETAVLP